MCSTDTSKALVRDRLALQSEGPIMVRYLKSWAMWAITFLCACSSSVPTLPVQRAEVLGSAPTVLVIRPGGYKPVDLTREELQQGMRMLYANGPLPGLPKSGKPRLILASADPAQ